MTNSSDRVVLLGAWPSPFVIRVRIALNIKSVKYEFLEETFGTRSELLLKSNPVNKQIPVLIHDGRSICESMIIVQYVDHAWSNNGHSILPSDPYERAMALFWPTYIDGKWFPALKSIVLGLDTQTEEERERLMDQLREGFAFLEDAFNKASKGKDFFGGDNIGYLDIAFGSFLGWVKMAEVSTGVKLLDEAKTPGLSKWADKFCVHDSVKGLLPETQKLVEFGKMLRANLHLVK